MEYVMRFVIGGAVVSIFAVVADMLRPKSFAGLLGAAPSVALATLALAFSKHGAGYVRAETISMMIGSVALAGYSFAVCQLLVRAQWSALAATCAALAAWIVIALGLEQLIIG